jgi:hypothetical protein
MMEALELWILLEKLRKPEKGRPKRKVQFSKTKLEISWSQRPKFKQKSYNFVDTIPLSFGLFPEPLKQMIRTALFFLRFLGAN